MGLKASLAISFFKEQPAITRFSGFESKSVFVVWPLCAAVVLIRVRKMQSLQWSYDMGC